MTDRGPSAEAGWGCGNVGNPGPDRGTTESAGKDCPHFHGPNQKESYMKKPRRAVAEWKAPNRDRPPTAGSVGRMWSIRAPNAKPECGANKDCPQAFHALRAAANEKQPNAPRDRKKNGTQENKPPKSCNPAADEKRTLNNPLPTRFHQNFDGREIQLLEHRGWTRSGCAARTGSSWRSASRSSPSISIGSG